MRRGHPQGIAHVVNQILGACLRRWAGQGRAERGAIARRVSLRWMCHPSGCLSGRHYSLPQVLSLGHVGRERCTYGSPTRLLVEHWSHYTYPGQHVWEHEQGTP